MATLPVDCAFEFVENPCDERAHHRDHAAIHRALQDLCEAVNGPADDPPESLFGNLLVRFRLTEALVKGGTAAAVRIDWNGSAWVDGDAITVADVLTNGMWQGLVGYEGWARRRDADDVVYAIVVMQRTAYFIWGTLGGSLVGGSASLSVSVYSDGNNPGASVTVYDRNGRWPDSVSGGKAIALYDFTTDRYEVVSCQNSEWTATATANQDFGPGTATVAIVSVTFKTFEEYTPNPPTPTVAHNTFGQAGKTGDLLHLQRSKQSGNWEIITGTFAGTASAVQVHRFRLSGNLQIGSNALAKRLTFDGATYNEAETIRLFDAPYGLTANAPGGQRGMWSGTSSMEGWCRKREVKMDADGPDEYEIVWMEQWARFIHFTLTENMGATTALEANATVEYAWGQGDSPGASVIVHDDMDMWHFALTGAKGTAVRNEYLNTNNPQTPYYTIVTCQQQVLYGKAQLAQDTCADDKDSQITQFRGWTPSLFNQQLPEGQPLNVKNTFGCAGKNSEPTYVVGEYKETEVIWHIVQVKHVKMDVVNSVLYDPNDKCIKGTLSKDCAVMTCGSSGPFTVICGEVCKNTS